MKAATEAILIPKGKGGEIFDIETLLDVEPSNEDLNIDKDHYCYNWTSHFKKTSVTNRISNFIMVCHCLINNDAEPKRLCSVLKKGEPPVFITIPVSTFSNPAKLAAILESMGNYVSSWNSKQLAAIKEYLFSMEKRASEVTIMGHQCDTGYFAFADGIFDGQRYLKADSKGFVIAGEQLFFLPASVRDAKGYENERKFSFVPGPSSFKVWGNQIVNTFGDNGKIGLLYVIAALFRDIIFGNIDSFPVLFLFGPKGTGKTTFRVALKRLFGKYGPKDAISLESASTTKSYYRQLAQSRNDIVCFEEYKNNSKSDHFGMLKGIYDGIGYSRAQTTNDNKTHSTNIESGVIVAGQEMPTKEPAFFSRVIMLVFSQTSFSDEEREQFQKMEAIISGGIGNVLIDIIRHRDAVESGFSEAFQKIFRSIRKDPSSSNFEERSISNAAALLVPFCLLENLLPFPFNYSEAYKVLCERIGSQQKEMSSSNEFYQFWQVFDYLAANCVITEGRHYKISKDKDLIFIRLELIYSSYVEQSKKQSTAYLDKSTLENYLTMHPSFKRPQRGGIKQLQRFKYEESGDSPKQCIGFELGLLNLENIHQNVYTAQK